MFIITTSEAAAATTTAVVVVGVVVVVVVVSEWQVDMQVPKTKSLVSLKLLLVNLKQVSSLKFASRVATR